MINPKFFVGEPVNFNNICWVYPPKVKDIINNDKYGVYKKLLLMSQEDIEDTLVESHQKLDDMPTPLDYLLLLGAHDNSVKELCEEAFKFFLHEPVLFLPELHKVIVGDIKETLSLVKKVEQLRILDNTNFFEFQNLLRQAVGESPIEPYNPNENSKIKYFKAKARLRDRVKAQSAQALNLGSTLAAICCMNFGINPLNIGELSQPAINTLIRYYQEKTKYETEISMLLAGADSKKVKPQNWIRNIEDL